MFNAAHTPILKRSFYLIFSLLLIAGLVSPASALQDDSDTPPPEPSFEGVGTYRGVSTAARFDISPPLSEITPVQIISQEGFEFPELPTGLEGPLGPQDADPIVQGALDAPSVIPTPSVSFNGPPNLFGGTPPDPVGDIGPNHYVAMSNVYFQIFNRSGTSLYGPAANNTLWSGFGGDCQTDNAGDPIVVYDQLADRWILTQFTASGPEYFNCVAVSQTGDPTGAYYRYAFSTGNNFPDYPKYGIWPDALYISTREFANGLTFVGMGAYAVNRLELLAGDPTPTVISFLVTPASAGGTYNIGDGLLPTDLDGTTLPPPGSPNYFVGSMDNGGPYSAPQDALTLWKFTADFVTPANSSFVLANTIPITAYDTIFPCSPGARNCIPQPDTTTKVDILSYRQRPMWRLAYRNFGSHESLVTNQSVEAATGIAGIRWWEIRSPNSSPFIYQEGTYAPGASDGIHRWMGSIAMDNNGNMALGYSASDDTSTYPSVWYTGRRTGDPLGTMPQGEASIIDGTGSQTGSARWGDYTSMNIDPLDDCTFWYVNQWIPVTSSAGWQLRIGAFKYPSCVVNNPPLPVDDDYPLTEDTALSIPVAPAVITTTFNADNSFAGNMFDLTANTDLHITGFDMHIIDIGIETVEVYYKVGTYAGFETTPAAWTLLGTADVNSLGSGNPTFVPIGGLAIPAGQVYGLYLQSTTSSINYLNGSSTYTDTNMTLDLGVGLAPDFGTVFSPRTWNGRIYYFTGGVLANDSDPNGDNLIATLDTLPSHGSMTLNPDGSFDYTPAPDFFGSDTFTYLASDGELSAPATVMLDVAPVPDPPVGVNDSYLVAEDSFISVGGRQAITTTFSSNNQFNGNMFDLTALTDITITGFDMNILGTGVETALVYYKPGTYAGSETNPADWTLLGSAQVVAKDLDNPTHVDIGGLSIPAGQTYGLYLALQDPAGIVRYSTGNSTYTNSDLELDLGIGLSPNFGATGTFSPRTWNGRIYYDKGPLPSLITNDYDPDSDFIDWTLDSGPSHGLLSVGFDGSFVYTPTINFAGVDTFTYIVSDGVFTDTAQVELVVTPDSPLVDAGADQSGDEGDTFNFAGSFIEPVPTTEAASADSYLWDFGDGSSQTGVLTTTHTYLDNGMFTATLTITDSVGGVGSDNLVVTVTNVAPLLDPLSDLASPTGEQVDLSGSFSDPGVLDSHTVEITWEPGVTDSLSLAAGTLVFSASHTYLNAGVYPVTVEVIDKDGGSDSQTINITVGNKLYLPLVTRDP